ncbi:MAG: NADH-quinone oxidoreductase subunit J [Halobacteriales archaeon]|nr:NADH-quinone oxidoreductase subunit J [Halobacteriales archaeon]
MTSWLPDLDQAVFVMASVAILVASLKVIASEEVMHAVVWLSIALLSVAVVYLTLGAEVLASIQVLVYVGAVVTLILFTIMLTTPAGASEALSPAPVEEEL